MRVLPPALIILLKQNALMVSNLGGIRAFLINNLYYTRSCFSFKK